MFLMEPENILNRVTLRRNYKLYNIKKTHFAAKFLNITHLNIIKIIKLYYNVYYFILKGFKCIKSCIKSIKGLL